MFYNTLPDPLRYFLHFGSGTDRVFRFGFGSDFGFRILCPAQYDFLLSFVLIDYKNTFNPFPSFSATQSDSFVSRTFFRFKDFGNFFSSAESSYVLVWRGRFKNRKENVKNLNYCIWFKIVFFIFLCKLRFI